MGADHQPVAVGELGAQRHPHAVTEPRRCPGIEEQSGFFRGEVLDLQFRLDGEDGVGIADLAQAVGNPGRVDRRLVFHLVQFRSPVFLDLLMLFGERGAARLDHRFCRNRRFLHGLGQGL